MNSNRGIVIAVTMVAAFVTAATDAAAQCPTTLPPSLVASVRNPEARAAAQGFQINDALIAQAGGLPTMIAQVKGQIASDQATAAEERRNQTYLARIGMANDRRGVDGRLVIDMMEDAHRLNTTTLHMLECHAARTGTGIGAPTETTASAAAANARNAFASRRAGGSGSIGAERAQDAGGNVGQALEDLTRTMRDRALVNASPEVAAFYAKQDAMQANAQANLAAVGAGQARGLEDARRGSVSAQVKMVTTAVKDWRAPAGYAHSGAVNAAAIQDPFAADARTDAAESVIAKSGLIWDRVRGLARVGNIQTLCGGRLKLGDYPVLMDGTLLDTPERIGQFLSVCGDVTVPLLVVRENGEVEVRQ
jgi:hypothetical protein